MKRILIVAFLLGCGGATNQPAKSRPAPTESDACERICTVFEDCRISPPNCASACAVDQQKLRVGIQPSLAACLEKELERCDVRAVNERREIVAMCFSAVVEAYAKDDSAVKRIVHAVCAREARCATEPEPQCETKLGEKLKASPQSKALAIARPEVLGKIAECVEKASCDDPDAVGTCTGGGGP
jgi:hypothetical protein